MKRRLSFVVLILVLGFLSVIVIKKSGLDITVTQNVMKLLDTTDFGYYVTDVATNTIECDLTTFSSVVNRMLQDSFELQDTYESDKYVEVVVSDTDLCFRLHYDSSGKFTSICNYYEKSYIPFTYITDE